MLPHPDALFDRNDRGSDGLSSFWKFVENRKFEVAVNCKRERARDWRRGHREKMRRVRGISLEERMTLSNTESVLLVDDHKRCLREIYSLLQHGVCTDQTLNIAVRNLFDKFFTFNFLRIIKNLVVCKQRDISRWHHSTKRFVLLRRENLRWGEIHGAIDCMHSNRRNNCFSS